MVIRTTMYRFTLLLLIASGVAYAADNGLGAEQKCDNTTVSLSTTSGSLKVALSSLTGTTCVWLINRTDTKVPLRFFVEEMDLDKDDVFEIFDGDSTSNLIVNHTGSSPDGFILTGLSKNVTVVLTLKDKTTKRKFNVRFSYLAIEALDIDTAGRITLPVISPITTPKGTFDLTFGLKLKETVKGKRLVSTFEHVGFPNAQSTIKYENAQNDFPSAGFLNASAPDAFMKDTNAALNIVFAALSYNSSVTFSYKLVDTVCSDYRPLFNETPFVTPIPAPASLTCLWAVQNDAAKTALLNFTAVSFFGPSDVLTISEGLNGHSASVIAKVGQNNLIEFQQSIGKRFVTGNYRVSLTTGYIDKPGNLLSLVPKLIANGGEVQPDTQVKLSGKEAIYTFSTSSDKLAALSLDKPSSSKSGLALYNSNDLNVAPFLTIKKDQLLPTLIPSDTNVLRVKVTEDGDGISAKFVSTSADSKTAKDSDSSLLVTSKLNCNQSASLFIPSRSETGANAFLLVVSKLNLLTENECLTLKSYNTTEVSVLNYCFDKTGKLAVNTEAIPSLLLSADSNYVLTYTRGLNCSIEGQDSLLQASVSFAPEKECQIGVDVPSSGNVTVAPRTYPNAYPLVDTNLHSSCAWSASRPQKLVLTVFRDIDLAPGQSLKFDREGASRVYDSKFNLENLPDDDIAVNTTLIRLDTPLEQDIKTRHVSGRGFKVDFVSADCGGYLVVSANGSISTPNWPKEAPAGLATCIWILKAATKDPRPLIEFSFQYDNTTADLVVYDNPTVRDPLRLVRFNETNNITNSLSSSVDSVVVKLTIKDPSKVFKGFNLNYSLSTCKSLYPTGAEFVCGGTNRCILPQWICNSRKDCDDYSDEIHCNGTQPTPPPPDCPKTSGGGVSGWVITLVIIPMAIAVGVVLTIFGPVLLQRFRGGRYQEFRDFSEVS